MTGPVFLVTGASSGIGAATARRAVEHGYRVILAARSEEALDDLAAELGGPQLARAVRADVSSWDDMQHLVDETLAAFGRLDVAFANAGFGTSRGFRASTPEEWREMVLTNVYGTALTIRATYEALVSSRGHLLLTGSVAGRHVLAGSLYSCTKWAITAMAEAARLELEGSGVRVTLVSPGITDTPFFDKRRPLSLDADDVARAVLYAVTQPAHVDVNEIVVRPVSVPGDPGG